MSSSLFDWDNYKEFLSHYVSTTPSKGARSALARAAQCQPAYITQVLGGNQNLSLEQAERIGQFLGLNSSETRYFLLLVQHERAGTSSLRHLFAEQIAEFKANKQNLGQRIGIKQVLDPESQATYYSSWHYAACHVLVSIARLANSRAMADWLGLPLRTVNAALDFLESVGLVVREGEGYRQGESSLHLQDSSPLITKHHLNWRLKAMTTLERTDDERRAASLHYSTVFTLSKDDVAQIKEILLNAISASSRIIRDSPEEVAYALAVDLFSICGKD